MRTMHERARAAAVEALAITHGIDVADAEGVITSHGGDDLLELDSKTAEFVIASIEEAHGLTLPTPADLGRDQIRSLGALLAALAPRLAAAS